MSSPLAFRPVGPAEVLLPCADLGPTMEFFVGRLGFRVEVIFPAEDPRTVSLSGYGLRLRLAPGAGDPGTIRLTCEGLDASMDRVLIAPNGTRVELVDADPALAMPPLRQEFIVTRQADAPDMGAGRAGMLYRDLIPGRLGGRFIASHIAIPQGGPVSDWVHFHKVRFQMIFCRRGWVRLVYEDQGAPFILSAGDCVLQPPQIRHRVLESSPGLEVVEIGCPALHETLADHAMELPTGRHDPDRDFGGQRFLRHVSSQAPWVAHGNTGFERQDTGMDNATRGIADVRVFRPAASRSMDVLPHGGELLFGFVLEGSVTLKRQGEYPLSACDAFVIPAGESWGLANASDDLSLLEVVLPAA